MTKNIFKTIQKKWRMLPQKYKAATVASMSSVLMLGVVAVSLHAYAFDRGDTAPCRIDPPASENTQQVRSESEPESSAPEGGAAQNELTGPVLVSDVAPREETPAAPAQENKEHKQDGAQVKAEQREQPEHKAPAKQAVEHKAPAEHKVPAEQKAPAPAPAQEAPKAPPQEVKAPSDRKPEISTPPPQRPGHWETVVEKPAWDEPVYEEVPNYERVGYAVFWADGYRSKDDQDIIRHMKELMDTHEDSSYRTEVVKEPRPGTHKEYVGMRHHDAITRQVWVVD